MKSELLIFDIVSGDVESVLETDRLIEAPNWTPDGAALIVNGGGQLFRVTLANPELHAIPLGSLSALNNDHGLSPDGRMLAISDKTETGESQIYIVPVDGGVPRPVGAKPPAYWHGWSPDCATLAYVARRDGSFQVCTCDLDGGPETQLTRDFDHCDGPDYTPDGRWIWFNGQRDGAMDLWRCTVAGGAVERMTDDNSMNWFPHPSPDGKHVLYLAYEPEVQGHPRDHDVELRLMPATGGASRKLLNLFGGQGSINVPNWAPDARRFAFVRYSRAL